jgi:predicted aminopeptidase
VRSLAFVTLVTLVAGSGGCWSGRYLARQGAGQLELLRARRRIDDVLADPATPPELKRRLTLAKEARAFGVRFLGLRGGDGFTRFVDSHGAPIAWNVTAARKDALAAYLHHFPIVGAIPYLGFFHEDDARREAERLRALDLDVYVRPVAGYSTLGFTADPIYSSMLEGSDARIVEVTLHEMLHATVYLAGHTEWNESLATVVGVEGAARFFAARGDASAAEELAEEARKREQDQETFAKFLAPVVDELERLYADPALSAAEKRQRREPIFARAQAQYRGLFARAGAFVEQPLNNAVILSFSVYHTATPQHHRLLAELDGNLAALIAVCRAAVENEPDPLGYLAHYRPRVGHDENRK